MTVDVDAPAWVEAGEQILAGIDLWADVPAATSRALQLAAVEAFAVRGYHGTSLRDIASGSGLSTAALYVHFDSKQDLLFEISSRGHRCALRVVEAAAALPMDTVAVTSALIYAFTRWHAEQSTMARIVQYEGAALAPEHLPRIIELRRQADRAVRGVLDRGVEDGSFDTPDVRGACAAVLSLGIDVARWYVPGGPYTPDALGRLYADLGLRMLEARPVPREPSGPSLP